MSLTSMDYIRLAQSLPPKLTRFFARYPPAAILPLPSTITTTISSASTLPSEDSTTSASTSTAPAQPGLSYPNPFKPQKSPVTGRWHDPVFSLRRQADLVKLAREHGVEELLPHTVKGTMERIRTREEHGLRVRGTGIGQQVKGKLSERQMKAKLEKRRQAMLQMPQMIATWKERGHGRGWKKWPK